MNDDFYIGYLPQAPAATARHVRRVVAGLATALLAAAALLASTLPHLGEGLFQFGQVRTFAGILRVGPDGTALLVDDADDYLLVGPGKTGVLEWCGGPPRAVTVPATLIERDARRVLELAGPPQDDATAARAEAAVSSASLGTFTLTGEIVDPKCYFGVMNPGEGRVHRACAVLCLRGGITPVFVARDRTGAAVPLLVATGSGGAPDPRLLRWVGEGVSGTGEVVRTGRWLTWRLDPATLRLAR